MNDQDKYSKALEAVKLKMTDSGCSKVAFKAFSNSFNKISQGESGEISEDDLLPVDQVPKLSDLEHYAEEGEKVAKQIVVINLNGGLGTSMGLDKAKSLLPVKNNLSFLEIIAHQLMYLREKMEAKIPLLLMNSFRTDKDSVELLNSIENLKQGQNDIPYSFYSKSSS